MTEPRSGALRPTAMKRTATLALATAALLVSGCGQQPASPPAAARVTGSVGSCAAGSASVLHALQVHERVDLDHDGAGNALMVTRPGSDCPNVLFSKVAGHYASLPLDGVRLDLEGAHRVVVPGRRGDLVAIDEAHPRGGFQVHLYAYARGSLAEVTTPGGDLPLPFVATDTSGGYVSASCTDQGFVVRQAVAHRPPGVVFAWDVEDTSYRLVGTTARATGTREVADNVLDANLAKNFPELVGRALFTSGCPG